MNKNNLQNRVLSVIERLPLIAIIITVIGILLICFPESALSAVLRASGVIILIYSIYRLISVFILDKDIFRTTLDLALTLAALIIGVLLLANPLRMSALISVMFGLYLIADGAFRLWSLAISKARYEYFGMPVNQRARIIKTALAAITLVVGVFLLIFPLATHKFMAIITGVCLLIEGIKTVISRIIEWKVEARKATTRKNPAIEAEFEDKTNK